MVLLAHRWHIFAAPDPLFFMVLLLVHTTPTAINMQVHITPLTDPQMLLSAS